MASLQVLLNDDISRQVFYHLQPEAHLSFHADFPDPLHIDVQVFRQTCYALARVCRGLTEPALDSLWVELYELKHLLLLLPSFLYAEDSFSFSGPIHTDHWTRLQAYARRVRRLQMVQGLDQLRGPVHETLQQMCAGEPLLPFLRDLRVNARYLQDALLLFITPALRHIRLHHFTNTSAYIAPRDVHAECAVIKALSRGPTELHTLSIHSAHLSPPAMLAIPKISSARIVKLSHVSEEANSADYRTLFISLINMQCLHTLTINIDSAFAAETPSLPDLSFPVLEVLTIYGPAKNLNPLLRCMSTPHLHTLSTYGQGIDELAAIEVYVEAISERLRDSTQDVSIRFFHNMNLEQGAGGAGGSLMQLLNPLRDLSQLRILHFSVTSVPALSFSDDDVDTLAQAWPRMYDLSIQGPRRIIEMTQPSLGSLRSFSQYCPQLHHLRLSLDCAVVPRTSLSAPLLKHRLQDMQIDMPETPHNPQEVARYIHHLFPFLDLERMSTSLLVLGPNHPWRIVLSAIKAMQSRHEA